MSIEFLQEFQMLRCFECCLNYAVTKTLYEVRSNNDEGIFCPSGHENFYEAPKSAKEVESEKTREHRRALALAIHRADQAEAKAAGATVADDAPEPATAADEHPVDVAVMQYGRIKCPSCDKTYKCQISLRKHLERVHKMEDTQIMAFFKACDAAEEANHAK